MPLYDIRNKFIRATGRDDLGVVGDALTGVNTGADDFINSGQKLLDRLQDVDKANARFQKDMAIGSWYQHLYYCRSILRVLLLKDDEWRPLEKIDDPIELLRAFGKPPEELTTGTPCKYAIWVNNLSPEMDSFDSSTIEAEASRHIDDLLFYSESGDNPDSRRTIIILPPADEAYTLMIVGKFESRPLLVNEDRSYWSENHPQLLCAAAQYCLEQFYRNTEGMKDHMLFIKDYLFGLAKDDVFEKLAENDFMRG